MKAVVQFMFGKWLQELIQYLLPLSNYTLSRGIKDVSSDVESTVVQKVRSCPYYALQLDESPDVSDLSVLLVFAHHVDDDTVQEEMLLHRPFKEHTTVKDIFSVE
jgi:hypothetical protein